MYSIQDPLEKGTVLNPLSEQMEPKDEEARLLDADRDIDEYKQQIESIAHFKEMKRQRNKNLLNIAKIIVMMIVFIYVASRVF